MPLHQAVMMNFQRGENVMKRYIRPIVDESSIYDAKYIIEIVFNYEPDVSNVAASSRVNHPKNVKKRDRLSDEQLKIFNDLVDSMIAPLIKRRFRINKEYQSKKGYSYYVDFNPVNREGVLFDESVRILFRASDHDIKHGEEGFVNEDLVLKSFTLFGEIYTDPFSLQRKVIDICEHLMDGDFMYVVNVDT